MLLRCCVAQAGRGLGKVRAPAWRGVPAALRWPLRRVLSHSNLGVALATHRAASADLKSMRHALGARAVKNTALSYNAPRVCVCVCTCV